MSRALDPTNDLSGRDARAPHQALMRSSLVQVLLALAVVGCATRPATRAALTRYEFQKPEMGVPFRIVLYAPGQSQAEEAAKAAFARIDQLNDIFTDYEFHSEFSAL